MKKKLSLLFLGLVLILFGLLWGGNSVGLWKINLFFPGWWTLILIVLPIYGMIQHGIKGFDIVVLVVGVVLLLSNLHILDWVRIRLLFFPALLVLIGLILIFSIFRRQPVKGIDAEARSKVNATFASINKEYDYMTYDGGHIDALFGSAELDLRNSIIEKDIYIQASAVFGGVKISFPPGVRVVVENNSVLGGVKNWVPVNPAINAPEVRVRCCAVLGGIELTR